MDHVDLMESFSEFKEFKNIDKAIGKRIYLDTILKSPKSDLRLTNCFPKYNTKAIFAKSEVWNEKGTNGIFNHLSAPFTLCPTNIVKTSKIIAR